MQLQDAVVFVTGGASGLGEAVVRRAIADGAKGVTIVDLSEDKANALNAELGDRVLVVKTDISKEDQVAAAVAATVAKFGCLDITVSCAGIALAQRTLDREGQPAPLPNYAKVIGVNLIGTFDVVRQTASAMAKNEPNEEGERGVVIMTASIAAFDGQVGQAAYSASKGGLVGMTLPLSRDLAPTGIRVMTIAPGLLDTPIYLFAPPGLKEQLSKTPVFPKRLGRPDEFAKLVAAIIDNSYLNGEVIRLDAAVRLPPK